MLSKSIAPLLGSPPPADGFQPAPSHLHANMMKKTTNTTKHSTQQAPFASSSASAAGDYDDIPPEVEEALKTLNSIIPLLGDDGEMRKQYKFSMNDYVKDRQSLSATLEDAAEKMDKVSRDTGIAKTTGGSVNIASGLAMLGGVVLAPFSGGASLALTVGGIAGTVAGTATTFTASKVKDANLKEEKKDPEGGRSN